MHKKRRVAASRPRRKAKVEISAGGIVYMRRRGLAKVALVGRFDPYPTWRLPKGHPERGEHLLKAARREIREETGVDGLGGPKLGTANFYFTHPVTKEFIHKYVHFFLLKKQAGSVEQHDKEYDAARWFTLDEAIRRASFKNDKIMLRRARQLIRRRQALGRQKKKNRIQTR
ncbi:MAG: NUDIX domain-containing protein [Parcubacteria group bacterium]